MEEFETLSEQLARVTAECERLREENARLCDLLPAHARPATGTQVEPPPKPVSATEPVRTSESSARADLSVPEKVALFRSLFRGREDVYALRWQKADGMSGYSPACRPWRLGTARARRRNEAVLAERLNVFFTFDKEDDRGVEDFSKAVEHLPFALLVDPTACAVRTPPVKKPSDR